MTSTIPRLRRGRATLVMAGAGTVSLLAAGMLAATPSQAAVSCSVKYAVTAEWGGGFVANVDVTNTGDALSGWNLAWTFSAGQTVTGGWNASISQSGSTVTATNVGYNATVASGATVSFGFQGNWSSSNPVPGSFSLNGVTCGSGSGNGGSTTTTTGGSTTTTGGGTTTTRPTTTTTRSTTTTTRTSTTTTTTSSGGGTNTTGLVGWATQNGGTTGGSSSTVVTVTSASALDAAISSSTSQTVRISGMLTISGMHKVASNKTIVGVGSGSGITGGGLTLSGVKNVIIRNLNFRNAGDDSINIESGTTNVWVDHNDLANGYDGLIDIKRGSDFITVSWNHLHDHDKSMLLGHSDDNSSQDTGHLRVTYHHNWLNGTGQRHPRVRFGNPVHVYNNYYVNIDSYGVASTENAGVLVESNYFENVEDPWHRGEGDSSAGSLVARNNHLVNSGSGDAGGSVASIPYSYTAQTASGVKASVTASAGVGKIGL